MFSEMSKSSHRLGSEVVTRDFYVDDLLTGANDVDTLEQIRVEVSDILESKGLELAKWFSNHIIFSDVSSDLDKVIPLDDSQSTKTLGLHWLPSSDVFMFMIDLNFGNLKVIKRNILSVSARLFDPLGLLSPILVKSKILLQELWILNLDWDESIP